MARTRVIKSRSVSIPNRVAAVSTINTLPQLAFVMTVIALFSALFSLIFVMTGGGPNNASTLLLFYIYQVAFSFWDSSYAAALSTVLLLLLGTIALAQFYLLDRKVHYR